MVESNLPCEAQCALNDRDCRCPLVWQLDRDSHCLVLLLNGREFRGSYTINDQTEFTRTKMFGRQQHQVKLCLKNDLELDTGSFLSRPIWIKKKSQRKKIKIIDGKYMEADSTFIRILERDQTTEISRFKPYTGKCHHILYNVLIIEQLSSISGWGDPKPVTKLSFSCGRVAALISGRVFVYCCRTLLFGTSTATSTSTTSTSTSTSQDSLLLVATRQSQPAVDDFVIGPNFLLTIGANTVVLFDFWEENTTAFSEFFS